MQRAKIVTFAFASACLLLAGCNTVEGIGKDVQSAGETVEDAAN